MAVPHGTMPLHLSAWQQGADAANAGLQSTDCPYHPNQYDFVTWHNGWSFKRHLIAIEASRTAVKTSPFKDDEEI